VIKAMRPTALVVSGVVPYPPIGGGEKRTLRLLEAIERCGANPYLISTGRPEDGAKTALRELGVELELVPVSPATIPRRLQQHLRRRPSPYIPVLDSRLAALVAERRPAFVQFEHTQNAYYFHAVRGRPVALSLHNVDSDLLRTLARAHRPGSLAWLRLRNRLHSMQVTERRAARAADAVLCVSEHDAASFAGVAHRVLLVPNGVDNEFFAIDPELPASELVLFFGKYDYQPNALGIARFVREGWPLVASRHPHARLRLVGRGMPGWLASEAGAAERVEVAGLVGRMDLELARSSAVVVPIWHGAGTRLKVLEALAAARPIAGTSLGVGNLRFEHARHGLVADSPADLAAAVIRLLEHRDLAVKLAAQGRRLAERYRWPAITRQAEELYRDWIEQALER
jgi:polysaccharide biosynthesis protein PslH